MGFSASLIAAAAVLFGLAAAENCAAAAAPATYTYTIIQYPGERTYTYGINDRGQVVGLYADNVPDTGLIYQGGDFSALSYPGATQTGLLAANDRGDILGRALVDGSTLYFIYDRGTFTMVELPGLPSDINNRGEVVGTYTDASGTHGYLYSGGATHALDVPDGASTSATGINDKDDVVGSYVLGNTTYGFRYSRGTYTTIAFPGALDTYPADINDKGEIVGSYQENYGIRGFVFFNGGYTSFVVPESVYCEGGHEFPGTIPEAINNAGEITGLWFGYAVADQGGFLARPSHKPAAASSACGR